MFLFVVEKETRIRRVYISVHVLQIYMWNVVRVIPLLWTTEIDVIGEVHVYTQIPFVHIRYEGKVKIVVRMRLIRKEDSVLALVETKPGVLGVNSCIYGTIFLGQAIISIHTNGLWHIEHAARNEGAHEIQAVGINRIDIVQDEAGGVWGIGGEMLWRQTSVGVFRVLLTLIMRQAVWPMNDRRVIGLIDITSVSFLRIQKVSTRDFIGKAKPRIGVLIGPSSTCIRRVLLVTVPLHIREEVHGNDIGRRYS